MARRPKNLFIIAPLREDVLVGADLKVGLYGSKY
jgi:hypothetical protein